VIAGFAAYVTSCSPAAICRCAMSQLAPEDIRFIPVIACGFAQIP
jgi:hypothetical protein